MPEQPTDDAVRIERLVPAAVDAVWAMWTDAARFCSWYGPAGATCTPVRFDLTVGGDRVLTMTVQTPGGTRSMWFVGRFLEIDASRRLVYTESMSDGDHGHPDEPATTVTLELTAQDGGTLLRLVHQGIPAGSPGAAGWLAALDKLDTAVQAR
jgi:uncharacterized protein YndB with AHSA1/START domain